MRGLPAGRFRNAEQHRRQQQRQGAQHVHRPPPVGRDDPGAGQRGQAEAGEHQELIGAEEAAAGGGGRDFIHIRDHHRQSAADAEALQQAHRDQLTEILGQAAGDGQDAHADDQGLQHWEPAPGLGDRPCDQGPDQLAGIARGDQLAAPHRAQRPGLGDRRQGEGDHHAVPAVEQHHQAEQIGDHPPQLPLAGAVQGGVQPGRGRHRGRGGRFGHRLFPSP